MRLSVDPNFGQDAIDDARNYHLMRLNSPMYRQQLESAVIGDPYFANKLRSGQIPGSEHFKTTYNVRAGEEQPELSKKMLY